MIAIGELTQIEVALFFQDRRKPRVIAPVVEDSELRAHAELLDFVLDEKLCRLGEGFLHSRMQTMRLPGFRRQCSTTAPAMKCDLPEPLPPHAPL
jgi:hypothetical protein